MDKRDFGSVCTKSFNFWYVNVQALTLYSDITVYLSHTPIYPLRKQNNPSEHLPHQ